MQPFVCTLRLDWEVAWVVAPCRRARLANAGISIGKWVLEGCGRISEEHSGLPMMSWVVARSRVEGIPIPRLVVCRWGRERSRVRLVEEDKGLSVDCKRCLCIVRPARLRDSRISPTRIDRKEDGAPYAFGLRKLKAHIQLVRYVRDAEEVVTLVDACNRPDAHKELYIPCEHALVLRDTCHREGVARRCWMRRVRT